jgi:single-strand DNA-binding protein
MLNNISLVGRLTRNPELRATQSGTPVASFTVACDRDRPNAAGERETDFFDVVAWHGAAEFVAKYFAKGQLITVSGRAQIRDWTDAAGAKRRSFEIVARDVHFTGPKPRDAPTVPAADGSDEDDVPFS